MEIDDEIFRILLDNLTRPAQSYGRAIDRRNMLEEGSTYPSELLYAGLSVATPGIMVDQSGKVRYQWKKLDQLENDLEFNLGSPDVTKHFHQADQALNPNIVYFHKQLAIGAILNEDLTDAIAGVKQALIGMIFWGEGRVNSTLHSDDVAPVVALDEVSIDNQWVVFAGDPITNANGKKWQLDCTLTENARFMTIVGTS